MKLSVAILAGGKSSRMGTNKALLTINNNTFLDTIAGEMHSFEEVLICVDEKAKYDEKKYRLVEDVHKGIGPIEGIYEALMHAENEYVFVCATDMPFIKKELVNYISEFISSDYDCYVLREGNKVHPLCAIYSKRILPVLKALIENEKYKLINIFERTRTKYIDIELSCFDRKLIKNINTKEEYREIKKPVVFAVSGIKDSGKTGLIIKLINEFIKEGKAVGVIKHDGHDFNVDNENTDTFRFAAAGALRVGIYSDSKTAVMKYDGGDFDGIMNSMSSMDVVIIEGMKNSNYPKVEVVRKEISQSTVCDKSTLICVATNAKLTDAYECPVYDIDDVCGIYNCVKKYFEM